MTDEVTAWKERKVRHETKWSGLIITVDTRGKCYLFVFNNKNSNGSLKDLGGIKKEKQVR